MQAFCAAVLGLKIDGVTLYTSDLGRSVKVTAWTGDWEWGQDFWIEELRVVDPLDMARFGVYRPVRQAIEELAKEQKDAAALAWRNRT